MKLSVLERVVALSVLPREGSYVTLRIMNDLRNSLSFTEDELKKFGISQNGGNTSWEIDGESEIPIGEKATDIIIESLKKLDKQEKLPAEGVSLYEKFIKTE